MKRIHFLNSNLNNTKPDKDNTHKVLLNNKINYKKLETLLKTHYGPNVNNTRFKGVGYNGEYFVFNTDNKQYVCKCMPYSTSNLKQIEKELSILHKIQSNKHNLKYINPCLSSFITKDNIVNIFPIFKGITLRKLLDLISSPDFDKKSRYIITKYVIKQVCKALYQIHKMGISHRQIDLDSIVIELPSNLESSFQDKKDDSFLSSLVKTFTGKNDKISKTKPSKTNYETYRPFLNDNNYPLKIKLTNFGYGCGETFIPSQRLKNSKKTHNIKHHQNVNCSNKPYINSKDPFVNKVVLDGITTTFSQKGKERGKSHIKGVLKSHRALWYQYDLWCLGLLILYFILKQPSKIYSYTPTDIKNLDTSSLVDSNEFKYYLQNVKNHLLVPLNKRKSGKYVEEKINLDEKHS